MKRYVITLIITLTSLVSYKAYAVTLKNLGAETAITIDIANKKETVTLQPNETYDSKGKDASLTLSGDTTPVAGKGDDRFVISQGRIIAAKNDSPSESKSADDIKGDGNIPTSKPLPAKKQAPPVTP